MADHFYCKYKFTDKCIDRNIDCDNCPMKTCSNCENSWSSNVCSKCDLCNK